MDACREPDESPMALQKVPGDSVSRIVAWLREAIMKRVPVGYQDEAGFHAGIFMGKSEDI